MSSFKSADKGHSFNNNNKNSHHKKPQYNNDTNESKKSDFFATAAQIKPTEKEQNKNTSDTRYYDELFTRLRDPDDEFNQDAEAFGNTTPISHPVSSSFHH